MAAATAGGGGGLRSPALHVGDGTVRRAAYHDARTAQICALESGALAAQRPLLPVVTVPAASVVVDEDGPNYRPPLKREPKKQRKQRRYAKALRVYLRAGGGGAERLAARAPALLAPTPTTSWARRTTMRATRTMTARTAAATSRIGINFFLCVLSRAEPRAGSMTAGSARPPVVLKLKQKFPQCDE